MPYYDELKTLISSHLDDLKDNRLPLIERKTGYSIEKIQEAWDELRKLNPKPGAAFSETFVPTVTPDVVLEQADDGTYHVVLEDQRTPRLFISDYYRRRLMSGQATPEEQRVHQTQSKCSPVAHRLDRTTAEHANQSRPGNCRLSERVLR